MGGESIHQPPLTVTHSTIYSSLKMQFKTPALFLALAAVASATPTRRVQCPEAARYGLLTVSPSTAVTGDVSPCYLPIPR